MSYKKWHCLICDLVYDEEQGWPNEGIAPGTRWEDVPDTWACPDCGASKGDFLMVEAS
ncbi:rubredoxin [Sinimarinibacterium flocculans]|uniref:rubredoxin n=1 Tax=Sinimarinibacterium flocculans TaxID=985250 RepID=UPI00351419C0